MWLTIKVWLQLQHKDRPRNYSLSWNTYWTFWVKTSGLLYFYIRKSDKALAQLFLNSSSQPPFTFKEEGEVWVWSRPMVTLLGGWGCPGKPARLLSPEAKFKRGKLFWLTFTVYLLLPASNLNLCVSVLSDLWVCPLLPKCYHLGLCPLHCIPPKNIAWHCHPHTQGIGSPYCSPLWFPESGNITIHLQGSPENSPFPWAPPLMKINPSIFLIFPPISQVN